MSYIKVRMTYIVLKINTIEQIVKSIVLPKYT